MSSSRDGVVPRHPLLATGLVWLAGCMPTLASPDAGVDLDVGFAADGADVAGVDLPGSPTACFIGAPPTADVLVADVPVPDAAACPPQPKVMPDLQPGPGTLAVEVGEWKSDSFVGYPEGSWALLVHGAQGLIHVAIDVRVVLPPGTPDTVKAHVWRRPWQGCMPLNHGIFSAILLERQGLAWVPAHPLLAVLPVAGSSSWTFCGAWVRLHVAVLVDGTKDWGEVQRTVRLYDQIDTRP